MSLKAKLLTIGVPLGKGDAEAPLDLQDCLDEVYEDSYEFELDYGIDPIPPLSASQAKWAKKLLSRQAL